MLDWLSKSAADLGRGIGDGAIDPVALTQAFLGAIHSHDQGNRIYARLTEERALAEAEAAAERARAGERLSPLDGVPISWKDLFDTAGTETEAGSRLLEGNVPEQDCEVLRNAAAAGMVCLGKTHMSELAFSGLGFNPITATSPCINDPKAVSGGSSSGAAASVAFQLAAAAIGSDTGGSVRIPAAWNDLVGLKTTAGRLPLTGVVPLCSRFDTVGPLCRTVEDAALLLGVLEGAPPADILEASLKGTRLAVLQTVVMDDLHDAPRTAFQSAVERLQAAGAHIDRIEVPEVTDALALAPSLVPPEAYGEWGAIIEERPGVLYAEIEERILSGKSVSGGEFVAAWHKLEECRGGWDARVAGYDAVIMPSVASLPPALGKLSSDHAFYVSENLRALRNTRVGNLLGLSAITLPTGIPSCGIMFFGPPMGEGRLLRLAKAAEDALS